MRLFTQKILPKNNSQSNHAEAKQKIFHGNTADSYPQVKRFPVHDDVLAGKVTIYQDLKEKGRAQKNKILFAF